MPETESVYGSGVFLSLLTYKEEIVYVHARTCVCISTGDDLSLLLTLYSFSSLAMRRMLPSDVTEAQVSIAVRRSNTYGFH